MRSIVMLLVAAALSTGRADAQPAPWQPDRLSPGWVFTPTMAVGTMWDSNVTILNEGNPLIQEWVGIVNPRGELDYNGRRMRFNTGYSGTLEAYRQLPELNRYEQRARASTQYQATPRLQTQAQVSYTAMPTTDRLELDTLPFADYGGRSFDASGGLVLRTSPRTQFTGQYQFQYVTFDRDQTEVRSSLVHGGYAHSPVASIQHSLTGRFTIGAQWQYRRGIMDGEAQRFNVQTVLGQVGYRVSDSTSVSGGAGVAHLDVSNTNFSKWGPSFHAGLDHRVDRTTLNVRYSKTFVPSFSFGGLAGNQDFFAGAQMPITRSGRLLLNGSVSYGRGEPVVELGVGYGLDSWWTNVSLGYLVARWLRTEGFLSTMHQNSTARGNIDRMRVGIQFVTFKPVRIQ